MSVGKCFTIEALVKFFNMANKDGNPANNRSPLFHILMMGNNKQVSFNSVLNKIIDEFLLLPSTSFQVLLKKKKTKRMKLSHCLLLRIANHAWKTQTSLKNYSSFFIKYMYFFILLDFKDAVREGNGETLATLH